MGQHAVSTMHFIYASVDPPDVNTWYYRKHTAQLNQCFLRLQHPVVSAVYTAHYRECGSRKMQVWVVGIQAASEFFGYDKRMLLQDLIQYKTGYLFCRASAVSPGNRRVFLCRFLGMPVDSCMISIELLLLYFIGRPDLFVLPHLDQLGGAVSPLFS